MCIIFAVLNQARLAQLVVRLIRNEQVGGSNPLPGSTSKVRLAQSRVPQFGVAGLRPRKSKHRLGGAFSFPTHPLRSVIGEIFADYLIPG